MRSMPPRRRAPKACHACRDRKVKCDVSSGGIPCQNCIRTKTDCSVLARKKRATKNAKKPRVPLTGIHVFEAETVAADEDHPSLESAAELAPWDANTTLAGRSPAVRRSPQGNDTDREALPNFILRLRPDLDPEVLYLLQRKKALSLPLPTVREELLRAYVCYVHPFLPLLDLQSFLDAVCDESGYKKISLVLYQAVLFAATAFVDIAHLRAEGFESRKEARRSYFDRVKLLFNSDVEPSPVTLVQVLLLMTYWYDRPADIKGRSHWMGIALSFANDIGLGHPSELAGLSLEEQKHRRRLWYCCLMRDMLISMSELRPCSISIKEACFPPLLQDDFECLAFASALEKFSGCGDSRPWRVLVHLCFQKVQLCVLIGRILRTQYVASRLQISSSTESTISLGPDLSASAVAEFVARDQEVRQWSSDMCPVTSEMVTEDLWRSSNIVSVHCSSLEMLYYTVLGLVHRPQLLMRPPVDSVAGAIQDFSRKTLRESALRITQLSKVFVEANLLRFLPPIGVTALLSAAVQHTKDAGSSAPSIGRAAKQNLDQSRKALTELQDMYFSADHAMAFIELIGSETLSQPGPDLNQMTVFPLFRDELIDRRPQSDLSCTHTAHSTYDFLGHTMSSHVLHAAMDAALVEPCVADEVDTRVFGLSSASIGHPPGNVDVGGYATPN